MRCAAVERHELTSACLSALKGSDELRDEYRRRDHAVQAPEELAAELKQAGVAGLSAALNNGLSEEENTELVEADDPQRIVALILGGLRRKLES
jgi:hypothetical protein